MGGCCARQHIAETHSGEDATKSCTNVGPHQKSSEIHDPDVVVPISSGGPHESTQDSRDPNTGHASPHKLSAEYEEEGDLSQSKMDSIRQWMNEVRAPSPHEAIVSQTPPATPKKIIDVTLWHIDY
eukprot:PhF_6_TR26793/c0_g1_i1/m.39228